MSASSFPTGTATNNKWKKRKRETSLPINIKKHKNEDEDYEEEDEDEDEEAMIEASAAAEIEEEDEDIQQPITTATDSFQISRETQEVLSGGGTQICNFPIAFQHTLTRPQSILSAVERRPSQLFLENISHGQLQALSSVPRDSPSLTDQDPSSCIYVCTPPPIMEGRGVVKRYGNNRTHVLPMHADWFSPNSVHRLERQVVPHFFAGKSSEQTPEKYMDCRNRIVSKYLENPEKRVSVTDCQGFVSNGVVDVQDLHRIIRFLDHWGIINYNAPPPIREPRIGGMYLREEPNGELQIPSAALRSIYSLIHFDKPNSRFRPEDICSSSFCATGDEVSELDSRIRERLAESNCNYCSRPLPEVHYQSQKEADVMLCMDCFYEGRFVVGHSSIDFLRVNSMKDMCDLDGDNWTDQETLLLLEALEIFNENWNEIAEHVGSKSKAQCILHFIRLPMEDSLLENVEVPKTVSESAPDKEDGGKPHSNSNGNLAKTCLQDLDTESRLPFANSGNPVMALVAFLASAVGPRVAAACAHASLEALSKENQTSGVSNSITEMEGAIHGDRTRIQGMHSKEDENVEAQISSSENHAVSAPFTTECVKNAAKCGLAAAAMKAKLFADHEEREIQRMTANIINHQLKRLELKLKQFAEVETLLMKESEQVERTRQRFAAERVRMISTGYIPSRANTMPGAAAASASMNNSFVGRQPGQTNISGGYGNNPGTHPHMSFMPRQQPMFAFGPRLPLSAIHPSASPSTNVMFNNTAAPGGNTNAPNLGHHPMLRSVTGTNTNVG